VRARTREVPGNSIGITDASFAEALIQGRLLGNT